MRTRNPRTGSSKRDCGSAWLFAAKARAARAVPAQLTTSMRSEVSTLSDHASSVSLSRGVSLQLAITTCGVPFSARCGVVVCVSRLTIVVLADRRWRVDHRSLSDRRAASSNPGSRSCDPHRRPTATRPREAIGTFVRNHRFQQRPVNDASRGACQKRRPKPRRIPKIKSYVKRE